MKIDACTGRLSERPRRALRGKRGPAKWKLILGLKKVNEDLARVVGFLGRAQVRATCGAVDEALGTTGHAVGSALGPRRLVASWIVNAESGLPTGYTEPEHAENLEHKSEIIHSGLDLLRRMVGLHVR